MKSKGADILIRTKLRLPFTRPALVSRPRLEQQLAAGLQGPLTLLIAPAGFGKTTLLASLAAACSMPVAWLSLDQNDNQALRFLRYLIAAVQAADSTIGSDAAQVAGAAEPATAEAILTLLINDLDAAVGEMALVLDDYHLIGNPAIHTALAFLLDNCPGTFHLVIAGRSDPQLPLARLRARSQVVELRAADLRFTEPEADRFFNTIMGLELDHQSVAILEERSEGWIAGLQMAALTIQGRRDVRGFVEKFAGTNRFIMDFMMEEVLAREPEEIQDFLLQTSILTCLNGPLCDAVTETTGGRRMLEHLENRNLFIVPLDDERLWYRYHHLFADLLQARLYRTGEDQVSRLFTRAARWCDQDGRAADAVAYSLSAGNHALAAGLIIQYWPLMTQNGEIETVWSWLNALPEEIVRHSGPLSVAFCWLLWLMGRVDAVEPHLADAKRALENAADIGATDGAAISPGPAVFATLPAEMAALRSFVTRHQNDFDAAARFAEQALRLLPDDLPPPADVQLRSLISIARASALDGSGDLEKAVDAYAETIRLSRLSANPSGVTGITYRMAGGLRLLGRLRAAEAACRDALAFVQDRKMDRLPAAGIVHIALSEVLVERNDLDAARSHLDQAMALGKWSGRLDAVRNAAFALARLRQARQDSPGALAAIQDAEAALGDQPSALAKAELLALKAEILVRQGALEDAAQSAREAVELAGQDRGQTGQMAAIAELHVISACSRAGQAIERITQAVVAAESHGRWFVVMLLHIRRSLVYANSQQTKAALTDLEQALSLAQPEGFRRVFLDEGLPMAKLLDQLLAQAGDGPLKDYALHLRSQFDETEPTGAQPPRKASLETGLIEPISPREMEVLQLMAAGRTNKDIGKKLFISPGTVKAHTASIYRKLGCGQPDRSRGPFQAAGHPILKVQPCARRIGAGGIGNLLPVAEGQEARSQEAVSNGRLRYCSSLSHHR